MKIPANVLRAAYICADQKDKSRPYLGGVLLDPTDACALNIVATDGRMLLAQRLLTAEPHGLEKAIILPPELAPYLKGMAAFYVDMTIQNDQLSAAFFGGSTLTLPLMAFSYPEYRRVLPKTLDALKPDAMPQLNLSYVARMHKAFAELLNRKATDALSMPSMFHQETRAPVVFACDDDPAIGLIMPMAAFNDRERVDVKLAAFHADA